MQFTRGCEFFCVWKDYFFLGSKVGVCKKSVSVSYVLREFMFLQDEFPRNPNVNSQIKLPVAVVVPEGLEAALICAGLIRLLSSGFGTVLGVCCWYRSLFPTTGNRQFHSKFVNSSKSFKFVSPSKVSHIDTQDFDFQIAT